MMFITPTLLPSKIEGVTEKPQSLFRNFEGSPNPQGGDSLEIQWNRDLDVILHAAREGQATERDYERADAIYKQVAGRIKLTKSYRRGRMIDEQESHARIASLNRIRDKAHQARKDLWYMRQ